MLEVPQFSQVLPPLPDTPRGISETPMVRVPATASLFRTFQPHPGDALCCDYSGLRPIYATQSHPKMLTLAHIQSLSGAKLRSGSESPNARSCLENRERSFHLSQNENHHFTLCLQGCGRFHARKIGEPPNGQWPNAFMESIFQIRGSCGRCGDRESQNRYGQSNSHTARRGGLS